MRLINISDLFIVFIVAASYYYYNYQFVRFAGKMLDSEKKKQVFFLITFLVNYTFFMGVSLFQFHLIINWSLFLLLLLLEIWYFFKCTFLKALYLALSGVMFGLAINIFMRCGIGVLFNLPLSVFDNYVKVSGNIKSYPIFLGFVLTGILFKKFYNGTYSQKLKKIFMDRSSLRFSVILMIVLYGFLILNLMSYYVPGGIGMKIWGIKSAAFVVVGFVLVNYYTCRMSQLNLYKISNRKDRQKLLAKKEEKERLKMLAFSDTLTGCGNRQYLKEVWDYFEQIHASYCLCFLDLDGLKTVNDSWGHLEGDQYLRMVVKALKKVTDGEDMLFRIGGDEFLLLLAGIEKTEAIFKMEKAKEILSENSMKGEIPYSMSFSYGVAENNECITHEELIKLADKRAYEQKTAKHCSGRR